MSLLTKYSSTPKQILSLFTVAAIFNLCLILLANTDAVSIQDSVLIQASHCFYATLLLLLVAAIPKSELLLKVRLFWFCITVAMVIWLITKLCLMLLLIVDLSDWVYLLADYGYFAFFLVAALAHCFYVNQSNKAKPSPITATLSQLITITFMSGLFVYLVVVPSRESATEFNQHYSSFLFFILMDAYLLVVFAIRALADEQAEWRQRFCWMAISFALFLTLDLTELLIKAKLLNMSIEGVLAMLWYLPYLPLALAFSARQQVFTRFSQVKTVPKWLPGTSIMALWLLPLLHVAGHATDFFSNELKTLREVVLICWVMVFVLFLYLREWLSDKAPEKASVSQKQKNETSQHTHSLVEHLPLPSFILDKLGKIINCNNAAAEKLLYAQSDLKGTFFSGLLAQDEPLETLLRFSESSFSQSRLITQGIREAFFVDKEGKQLTCYVAFGELDNGEFIACLTDVSRLHEAELQALSIKDKFLANITHEFRTPLTIIQGAIEEALEKVEDQNLVERFAAAQTNTIRILKMVEQLLNLSKITSAPKLDKSLQPASQIIDDTCQQFSQLCQNKNIKFAWQVVPRLWIKVYDDSLQQILYNLLSNAYKYSKQDSAINLSAQLNGSLLRLDISDSGCGMTQAEQERLFERFQRADSAKRSETFGVGIGLSLVSELVNAHEWRIGVVSELNQGTTFTLEIPCNQDEQNALEQVTSTSKVSFNSELSVNKSDYQQDSHVTSIELSGDENKLFIIEDNPDMQDYLKHLMSAHYVTEILGNGTLGVSKTIEEIPDVIICDLMLPDISGFEVVKQIKAHPMTQHIPILMLTAKSDTQSKLTGLEAHADDYLTKPFHHKELLLRINNLLQNRARMQQLLRHQMQDETLNQTKAQYLPSEMQTTEVMPHKAFLDKLQLAAEQHYSEESFAPSNLASQLAMSERQLQRKLKAALDMTPGEYLREYRILKSRELLSQGISVGMVAEEVGFSNQNYFTRCFKQQYGITPSEYQKNNSSTDQKEDS